MAMGFYRLILVQDYIREVIIPDMQVKLRQGFGRAIRTETDTCVVSILDPVSYTHLDVYKRQDQNIAKGGLVRDIFYYAVETALFFTKRLDYANQNIVFMKAWR